ncbi:hypothetical protein RHDC4_00590 [Rhodocyclaceae bacterium]|nr:hypothetical protein RHDC4_00590 [Rhodocyclaceae bacterium]
MSILPTSGAETGCSSPPLPRQVPETRKGETMDILLIGGTGFSYGITCYAGKPSLKPVPNGL